MPAQSRLTTKTEIGPRIKIAPSLSNAFLMHPCLHSLPPVSLVFEPFSPTSLYLTMSHQLPKGQAQAQSQSVQRAKTGTGNGEFVRTFGLTEVDVKSAWQKKTRFRSATPDPVGMAIRFHKLHFCQAA